MPVIKYNLIGAVKANIIVHPQKDVENRGMEVLAYEGIPIADCIFMKVDIITELPSYIERSNWKFNK
jgi:hypothetical protein